MILKLRNKKIIIEQDPIPERIDHIYLQYDFELGTNHLTPILFINGESYTGYNKYITVDFNEPILHIQVVLMDGPMEVHKYATTYEYTKYCMFGVKNLLNMQEELERLYKENKKLKEKGELI